MMSCATLGLHALYLIAFRDDRNHPMHLRPYVRRRYFRRIDDLTALTLKLSEHRQREP